MNLVKCEAGKFKLSLTICETCPGGWVSSEKSENCIVCPKGKISDIYGLKCELCEAGKYNDLLGISLKNENCKLCSNGKYSFTKGADNELYCKDCPIGRYNNLFGLTSVKNCIKCAKGKYNIFEGQKSIKSCISCIPGKWSSILGSNNESNCVDCNMGLYSNVYGAISMDECKECPAGKFSEVVGVNTIVIVKTVTGSYSLKGSIYCKLCESGKYISLTGSNKCNNCEEGQYSNKEGSFICTQCPENSEQNYFKTECLCSYGSYNVNNFKNSSINCEKCNDEFICEKGVNVNTIKLKEHYWRAANNTIVTYKCKNIYACKGGLIYNTSDDLCQPGHKGPICDVCEKGWAKDDGVCLKCPENTTRTIGLTILIPFVCLLLIIFLIKTANPSNNKKEEVNGVMKIFMNYAQVFSLASSFQINWPRLIRYFFERAKEFSSPRVSFYSSDCAIGWSYYDKLIVYLSLPLFYMVMVTIVIAIISLCYCKKNKKKLKKMTSQIQIKDFKKRKPSCMEFFTAWEKTAVVVGTFLSWPTIVENTLEVMNCEKVGNTYYLVKDFSVICYDSKHYTFLIISYVAIIIYGIGIPLFGFYLLYKYRYRLYDMQNRYDGSTPLSFFFGYI